MDRWLTGRRQRRLLCAAILIPVAWSGLAAAIPARPHAVEGARPLKPLAFDQYLVNLRDVGLRPIVQGEFHFKNIGAGPLTITRLDPSCGCLKPRLAGDLHTYEPGQRGFFVVGVATANESPGPHTYTIKVHYEDPQPREAVLKFKLTLPERKLSVEPPELAFFQYNGQPSSAVIHVTDYRGGAISVTNAAATVDFIDVEVQEAVPDEHGNRRIPIVLHVPGTVPPGRTRCTLAIETTDAEFKKILIPVLVDGPSEIQQTGVQFTVPPAPRTP
ncbi:MAG: DUF1573 domain-containing protein [Planctomycetaceae bacterium]